MARILRIPTSGDLFCRSPKTNTWDDEHHVAALAACGGEAFPSRRQEWNPPTPEPTAQ
jgi:hypothetical protein